jgi:hypothetical protein
MKIAKKNENGRQLNYFSRRRKNERNKGVYCGVNVDVMRLFKRTLDKSPR